MDKILFVEDDSALGFALEFSLQDEGYDIARVQTIAEAKSYYDTQEVDLILLDVNLPDGNGYDFCKYIRSKSAVPIIFLTALDDEVNIVMGLELGANDYLTKPFGVRELLARIKVQLRTKQQKETARHMVSEEITVDLNAAVVFKSEQKISLTSLEYKLLILLLQHPMCIMSRNDIIGCISNAENNFFDENTLSVYMKRLRDKIEDDSRNPVYIITKRGLGYMWAFPVRSE